LRRATGEDLRPAEARIAPARRIPYFLANFFCTEAKPGWAFMWNNPKASQPGRKAVVAVDIHHGCVHKDSRIGRKTLVLAHGENGHSHVIEDDEAELIQIGERMLLNLEWPATVKHEEHGPINPGIWEIGRVKEYDWLSREGGRT
jgi:hypothetical protein